MSNQIESLYLGHDNSIDLLLKSDNVAVDLSSFTKMTITIGGVTVTSDNASDSSILWNKLGYATGEVRLFLGRHAFIPSKSPYNAHLVVYSPTYDEGLVWGPIPILVVSEVECRDLLSVYSNDPVKVSSDIAGAIS